MTSLNTQLWELISTHQMPSDASGRPFIDQLMDEHRISRDTATVAIEEYLKFMYLCATRTARNVPSKAVDLVWHLHMQHSRDYWDVFCKKIGKPVHHSPGGEGAAHLDDYKATYAAYRDLFGTPPQGIWRHRGPFEKVVAVIMFGILVMVALGLMAQGDFLLSLPFLIIGVMGGMASVTGFTEKGEYTLIFESDDPFADRDAGDCGSGCGGCGD